MLEHVEQKTKLTFFLPFSLSFLIYRVAVFSFVCWKGITHDHNIFSAHTRVQSILIFDFFWVIPLIQQWILPPPKWCVYVHVMRCDRVLFSFFSFSLLSHFRLVLGVVLLHTVASIKCFWIIIFPFIYLFILTEKFWFLLLYWFERGKSFCLNCVEMEYVWNEPWIAS